MSPISQFLIGSLTGWFAKRKLDKIAMNHLLNSREFQQKLGKLNQLGSEIESLLDEMEEIQENNDKS